MPVFHSSQVRDFSAIPDFVRRGLWVCARSPCGFSYLPRKGAVFCCFEGIWNLRRTTGLVSTARLVSNDICFVFRDLLKATPRFHFLVWTYILWSKDSLPLRCLILVICSRVSSSSVINYCRLLKVLFCGTRSENVIDDVEVGILENCEKDFCSFDSWKIIHPGVHFMCCKGLAYFS